MRISDWSSDVCSSDLRKAASALNRPPVEVVRRSHKADAKHGEADLAEIAVRNADARRHKADSGAAHRCGKQPVVAQITAPQRPGGKDDRNAKADLMDKRRSEEHTSELQSLMRISSAVFCLKKKTK